MSDDVIDGNVGTEYDEIDQSTIYFDGVPPVWTYEKLEQLALTNRLAGNFDVTTKGEKLPEVYYNEGLKAFVFKREISLNKEFCYQILKFYYENGNVETQWKLHDTYKNRAIFIADNQYDLSISEIKQQLEEFMEIKLYKSFIVKRESND